MFENGFRVSYQVARILARILARNYAGPYFGTLSTISIITASSTVLIFLVSNKAVYILFPKNRNLSKNPTLTKGPFHKKIKNNKPCSSSPRQMKKIFPVEENIKYPGILIYSNNCHSPSYTCHRPPHKLFYHATILVSEKNSNGDMFRSTNVMVLKEQQGPRRYNTYVELTCPYYCVW